ncbi:hypothetical protein BGZ58_005561 [Dissophora ornata]|nr:hypothetical protein BGZ58_005561 [Dissophora ornata]
MNSQKNHHRPTLSKANSKGDFFPQVQIDPWQQQQQLFASQTFAQEPIHDTASDFPLLGYCQSSTMNFDFMMPSSSPAMDVHGSQSYLPQQDFGHLWFPFQYSFAQTVLPQTFPTNSCVSPNSLALNPSTPHNMCHTAIEPAEAAAPCPPSPLVLAPEALNPKNSDTLKAKTIKTAVTMKTRAPRKAKPSAPFSCDHKGCQWKFDRRYNLESHKKTHDNLRYHDCQVAECNKSFLRKADLIRHNRKHTKEEPFPCEFCDLKFGRTEPRLRHYKREHAQATTDILISNQ